MLTTGGSANNVATLARKYAYFKIHKVVIKYTPAFTSQIINNTSDQLGAARIAYIQLPNHPTAPQTAMFTSETDYTYSRILNAGGKSARLGREITIFLKPRSYLAVGQPTASTTATGNGRFNRVAPFGWHCTDALLSEFPGQYDDYVASYAIATDNAPPPAVIYSRETYFYMSFKGEKSSLFNLPTPFDDITEPVESLVLHDQ